jgi:quercetin dioxygenase-like cupin family protein
MATRSGQRAPAAAGIRVGLKTGGVIVRLADGEAIVRRAEREVSILVAREELSITYARFEADVQVTSPHVHQHTDAFYVLEGELTFEIGREAESIRVSSGGFIAAPPQVAHSFRTGGDRPARWLTIHAGDGGFAAFMRGVRDGVEVEWDISGVPAEGGLPASEAVVSPDPGGERLGTTTRPFGLRCTLPDLCVLEWHLRGPHPELPPRRADRFDSFFVIEGEVEAMLAGTRQTVGPGTLISVPGGVEPALELRGSRRARVLSLHTPGNRVADNLRRLSDWRVR